MSKDTQVIKIIRYMAENPQKEWWYAPDFQRQDTPSEYFVGYEASARISDILHDYPFLMDVKREGRYRYIKLRSMDQIYGKIPEDIAKIVRQGQTGQRELF